MPLFKSIAVGLAFWLSAGLSFGGLVSIRESIKTGRFNFDGGVWFVPGGAGGQLVMGFIVGLILTGFSALVFAVLCWSRPWAFHRLLVVTPLLGFVAAAISIIVLWFCRPPRGEPSVTAVMWLMGMLSILPITLWCIPWLWRHH